MKLLKLVIKEEFRSLHKGFSIDFHTNEDSLDTFQPFCFAGLNGSGKSNILEALASIFYHLEFCVARFKPKNFEKHFSRAHSKPDAYILEYLIGVKAGLNDTSNKLEKVVIKKVKNKPPTVYVYTGFEDKEPRLKMPLDQIENNVSVKLYLPDVVVAYSSGENQTLSLPFIKNRLVNYDKYLEDLKGGIPFEEPETSLIYIDEGMSQAVLLAALILEDKDTLEPLKKELGVFGLERFTIYLKNPKVGKGSKQILSHLQEKIDILKKCATTWFEEDNANNNDRKYNVSIIRFDFFLGDSEKSPDECDTAKAIKDAFDEHFDSPFELFRFFQVLYELNSKIVSESIKNDVYSSQIAFRFG